MIPVFPFGSTLHTNRCLVGLSQEMGVTRITLFSGISISGVQTLVQT